MIEEYMEHSGYDWTDTRIIALSESTETLLKLVEDIKSESKDYMVKYKEIIYSRISPNEISLRTTELKEQYNLLSKYNIFSEIDGYARTFVINELEVI